MFENGKCRIFFMVVFVFLGVAIEAKTKILFVVHKFPKLTETFILSQITGLMDRDYDVTIWSCEMDGGDETDVVQKDVFNYNLLGRTTYIDYYDEATHAFIANNLDKYDIIYCQYDRIGCVFAKLKDALNVHGKLVVCVRGGPVGKRVSNDVNSYKILFKQADLFLPVCRYFKKNLMEHGCKEDKIRVHHSAIDCDSIRYKKRTLGKNEPIRILTVARLVWSKGIEYGIKAVANLCRHNKRRIEYTIIGGGKLKLYLQKLIDSLGMSKNIKLLDWQPHEVIVEHLRKSHIFLLSSIGCEGIPNAIMEAAASGLPVVSTKVNGIPEVVHHKVSGYLVSPENTLGLALALKYLILHFELWESFGKFGRAYIEKEHNIDMENNKLHDIFQKLLHT